MAEPRPGLLYKVDGSVTEVTPQDGKKFSLKELQGFVGGYIESVPHARPDAFCNEEGLLNGLPYNRNASRVFGVHLVRG